MSDRLYSARIEQFTGFDGPLMRFGMMRAEMNLWLTHPVWAALPPLGTSCMGELQMDFRGKFVERGDDSLVNQPTSALLYRIP